MNGAGGGPILLNLTPEGVNNLLSLVGDIDTVMAVALKLHQRVPR